MGKKKQRPPDGDEDCQDLKTPKKIIKKQAKPSPGKKTESKTKKTQAEEKDEISLQLEEERKQALEILNSMLGSTATGSQDEGDGTALPPTESDNEDLGECMHSPVNTQEKTDDQAMVDSYKVNTDLKMLFSSTAQDDQKQHGFSFFAGTEEEKESPPAESDTNIPHATIDQLSNDDRETGETAPPDTQKYFFFHSNNPALRNRLDDENCFHRTQSLEDLEWEWPERRTAMKEGFRRRRKDAVKLARKKRKYIPSAAPPDTIKISD